MLVKVTISREGLIDGADASAQAEALDGEPQAEQPHYYDEAVVLFALMLERAGA